MKCAWMKSACVSMFAVYFLCEKNTAQVCKLVCVSLYSVCVCICDDRCYATFSQFRQSWSLSCILCPRIASVHTHTQGIISHFPYLSMTLCVYVRGTPCVSMAPPLQVTDGLPQQQFTWGWRKVTFGWDNLHTSQEFFGMEEDSRRTGQTQDLRKCIGRMRLGVGTLKPFQIGPKRAKAKPSFRPHACAENGFLMLCKLLW